MHAHLSEIEILIIENIIAMETPKLYHKWVENCKHLKVWVEVCGGFSFHLYSTALINHSLFYYFKLQKMHSLIDCEVSWNVYSFVADGPFYLDSE